MLIDIGEFQDCGKMIKIRKVWNILMIVFLIILFSADYTSAVTDEYEENINNSNYIASRGTYPDIIDQEWKNSMRNCYANFPKPLYYYKFDKSIKSVAFSDILIVELKSEYQEEINDSRIDQMYQKIEEYCEDNANISNIPVIFMWAEDSGDLVMVYDPYAFEKAKNSSLFVASRGTVPIFANEDEWLQWTEEVLEARSIMGLESYNPSHDGPVLSFGFKRYSGYIEVGVNRDTPEKVNDSSINEIYQMINEHYKEAGISDIPVVFVWDTPVVIDVAEVPLSSKDDSVQTTPGFTFSTLILCLLILAKVRR
jgi:hypothetical protein